MTFDEDVAFLESQQAILTAQPDAPLVNTKHDKALIHANRAISAMIDREG